MAPTNDRHVELLARFVQAFSILDDLTVRDPDAYLPPELSDGIDDSAWARQRWKPAVIVTPSSGLDELYRHIPLRLPPLYEQLVLSYRWMRVNLRGFVELYANPPDAGLAGLLSEMTRDTALTKVVFAHGLLPFGTADDCYDPICFDTRSRLADGDCSVIQVEHEAILCDDRLGRIRPIAKTFYAFVESVVEDAATM